MNTPEQLSAFFAALRKMRGGVLTNAQVIEANRMIDQFGLSGAYTKYGITMPRQPDMISPDQWSDINPRANPEILKYLNLYLPVYGINTKEELVLFLVNAYIESMGFTRFRESFAYKPETLLKTFKMRVGTLDKAKELCAKGQEAIANFLYGGRYGNGVEEGWKYRGGGIFQTTFKNNYADLDKALGGVGLVKDPSKIVLPEFAVRSALHYWKRNNIDAVVSQFKTVEEALPAVRRVINGGTNGLDEARLQLPRIKKIMGLK